MTPPTLPGDRFRAAVSMILGELTEQCERKLFRAEGPRAPRDELLEWSVSGENVLRIGDTLYLIEGGLSVTELEAFTEAELERAAGTESEETPDGGQ